MPTRTVLTSRRVIIARQQKRRYVALANHQVTITIAHPDSILDRCRQSNDSHMTRRPAVERRPAQLGARLGGSHPVTFHIPANQSLESVRAGSKRAANAQIDLA